MTQFAQVYRQVALNIAAQPLVEQLVSRGAQALAQRFVAGATPAEAVEALQRLQREGIQGNLDLLGEFVQTPEPAQANTEAILQTMQLVAAANLRPYSSVKLSSIGQGQRAPDGREDLSYIHARRIVQQAQLLGDFVALDMEDHTRVDFTLGIFRRLAEEFGHQSVGTVLQAYLYRTPADWAALRDLAPNLRIVKGAYLEPGTVAMQQKSEIDAAYRQLVFEQLKAGHYCNVATHDHHIIYDVMHFAQNLHLNR